MVRSELECPTVSEFLNWNFHFKQSDPVFMTICALDGQPKKGWKTDGRTFGQDCHSLQAFMTVLDVMHMEHTEAWNKEDPQLGTPSSA